MCERGAGLTLKHCVLPCECGTGGQTAVRGTLMLHRFDSTLQFDQLIWKLPGSVTTLPLLVCLEDFRTTVYDGSSIALQASDLLSVRVSGAAPPPCVPPCSVSYHFGHGQSTVCVGGLQLSSDQLHAHSPLICVICQWEARLA